MVKRRDATLSASHLRRHVVKWRDAILLASRLRRHVVKWRDAILSASRLRRHLDKHAKLFCRRSAYANTWLNGEMESTTSEKEFVLKFLLFSKKNGPNAKESLKDFQKGISINFK